MEATLTALNAASESVRAACHAGYSAPASPDSLYIRGGVLVEVLDRLRQVAFTLGNHAERAATEAAASGCVLETDNGTPASDYTYTLRPEFLDQLLADPTLPASRHGCTRCGRCGGRRCGR